MHTAQTEMETIFVPAIKDIMALVLCVLTLMNVILLSKTTAVQMEFVSMLLVGLIVPVKLGIMEMDILAWT